MVALFWIVLWAGLVVLAFAAGVSLRVRLREHVRSRIPVVDDEHRPAFVISVRDVVEFLVDAFPREILNLPAGLDPSQRTREGA